MINQSLEAIPFHNKTEFIKRIVAVDFPVHLAVHQVSAVLNSVEEYTQPHVHNNCDEINIILSRGQLSYRILIGDREEIISNNSAIWIPRGIVHSANVISGSGFFVTLRINQ